jgi:YaiO family outer membrane protein
MKTENRFPSRAVRGLLLAGFACLFTFAAMAQSKQPDIVPQGSSIPGWGTRETGLDGPGYIEFGGSRSNLSSGSPVDGRQEPWTDFYIKGAVSGGKNTISAEATRQQRFGELGYFYTAGWTRTISENWYGEISGGISSPGGLFLPKWSADAIINRKLLPRRQLVLSAGYGYDKSKLVNTDSRYQASAVYYFEFPIILQGGVTFTKAQPSDILARTQFGVVTWGREKEHYLNFRAEIGREAYEIVGPNTLFDFPVHNYSASWRQWLGLNWGFNVTYDRDGNPFYHRNGGIVAFFFDF